MKRELVSSEVYTSPSLEVYHLKLENGFASSDSLKGNMPGDWTPGNENWDF